MAVVHDITVRTRIQAVGKLIKEDGSAWHFALGAKYSSFLAGYMLHGDIYMCALSKTESRHALFYLSISHGVFMDGLALPCHALGTVIQYCDADNAVLTEL
eukprot:6203738-Pleurochrysis_carterae.AAC.1